MEKCWNCGADKENPHGLCSLCGRFPVSRNEERLKEYMEKYTVFSDGSCSDNPGPGGWAVIVIAPDGQESEYSGHQAHTTNIRMELVAVGRALQEIPWGSMVEVYHDYTGIGCWLRGEWKRKDPTVKLLCEGIEKVISDRKLSVTFHHVKGHDTSALNNRVDQLAVQATKDGIAKRGEK